jgi:hypothetical protein
MLRPRTQIVLPLSISLNKFRELTSPEDLHIYRKAKERFTRVQRIRTLAHS